MTARTVLVCLALSVTTSACLGTGFGRRDGLEESRTGIGWKVVARKVEPNYLVAIDQTSCTVSTERFRQINAGQRVLCDWRAGVAHSGRIGVDRDGTPSPAAPVVPAAPVAPAAPVVPAAPVAPAARARPAVPAVPAGRPLPDRRALPTLCCSRPSQPVPEGP